MIRLMVADDHPIVREGLKQVAACADDIDVVAEAVDGDGVLARLERGGVDVVLLDISMPGPGFLEILGQVRSRFPAVRVLVLSVHSEDLYAVRALKAGAAGYLTKDHSPGDLVDAVRRVSRGGRYVSSSLAEKLASALGDERPVAAHEKLSDREYEVMLRLARGAMIKEIAGDLDVSPKTVSTYRARALEKLGLRTTADLVRYVIDRGLADR